jgi:ABC-type branched-subunit amino acid transport system ATPase component
MSLLSVRGLKVAYGGIQAVRGIDFEVAEGELVCLIGANGAGKSSTLKGVMGLAHPHGEVLFAGERLHKLPTHAIACRGLALVPEGRGIFGRLTVAENLDMGAYTRTTRWASGRIWPEPTSYFPVWRKGAANWRAPFPAASSRCSPSPAPSWAGPACCCWMSRAWDWRRSW